MDIDYEAAWKALPEDLRNRLEADAETPLSADDVAALVHAGTPVAMAYWVSQLPEPGARWYVSPGLRKYIEQLET